MSLLSEIGAVMLIILASEYDVGICIYSVDRVGNVNVGIGGIVCGNDGFRGMVGICFFQN